MSEIKLVKKTMEDFSKEQFEKLITEHATYKSLVEILLNQLQQKENIIKEVREYIDRRDIEWGSDEHKQVLEILDKADKENK